MSLITRSPGGVERAYSILTVKKVSDGERIIEGIASTPTPDRMGDIVEPEGAQFKTPMPLLWQHDHGKPVGFVEFAKPNKNGIPFRARILAPEDDDPQPLKDRLAEAWKSVKRGLVRAVSIGFKSLEHSVMDDGGWRFLSWEWLELSLVTIPANSEATINTVKSIDRDLRAASGALKAPITLSNARAGAPSKLKIRSTKGDSPMTTISEQISAWEAELETKKTKLNSIQSKAVKEGRGKDEAEQEEFDELIADVKAIKKELEDLTDLEEMGSVAKAAPVKEVKSAKAGSSARAGDHRTTVLGPNSNIPKGIPFARAVLCKAFAKVEGGDPVALAERNYPDDARIANYLKIGGQKAAVPAAYTSDSGGWAEDIAEAQTIGSEFIEFQRPGSIIGQIDSLRKVDFNVKVPRLTTGQSANWVGEAKGIAMTSGVFDTVTLGKTKVAAISALTKEQIRFSNINAEAAIRDDLARSVNAKLDSTLVSTAAASAGVSPAGLLNGLSAISANGSGAAADIRSDIQDLIAPFAAANISRRQMVLVMHENLHLALMLTHDNGFRAFPDITAEGGSILGMPVVASNHVAAGDVILVAAPYVLLADDGDVSVSMSDQASLEMLDGSLEQDGTDGTGATTAGVVSLWQTDMVGIKIERYINWQKALSASVAYIGDAGWNGVATS